MIYNENGVVQNTELKDIIKFNKYMNKTFLYGLAINGVIDKKRNTTGEDYDKLYKFASPTQFEKQNGGVCWDYVTYEADYFSKNFPNIKYTAYYVVFDDKDNFPTHTFLILYTDSQYIYFESSFKMIQGVYSAKSEKDIINFVLDSIIKHESSTNLLKCPYYVFKYNPLDPSLNGMSCMEFMKHIEDNGYQISHKFSSNYNLQKL